jgi:hypothetical protein
MLGAPLGFVILLAATSSVESIVDFARPEAPAAPDGCRDSLKSGGVRFTPWLLRPARMASDTVCEAPEGVAIRQGAEGPEIEGRLG